MNEKYLIPLFIFGTIIITSFALILTVFVIIQRQRRVRNRMEHQQMEFHYRSELLKTQIEVQEQALQMVSQEIHDNVGQVLSFSCLRMSALKGYVTGEGLDILNENLDLIRQSVKNLRLLSHSLNTGLVEKRNLEEAIQSELDRMKAFSTMHCLMKVDGEPADLKPETKLLVFRIIQEALQNVVKHADANSLVVQLLYEDHKMELKICDDGKGIDHTKIDSTYSLGLANMHHRAAMLKGQLSIGSEGDKGVVVSLKIPL